MRREFSAARDAQLETIAKVRNANVRSVLEDLYRSALLPHGSHTTDSTVCRRRATRAVYKPRWRRGRGGERRCQKTTGSSLGLWRRRGVRGGGAHRGLRSAAPPVREARRTTPNTTTDEAVATRLDCAQGPDRAQRRKAVYSFDTLFFGTPSQLTQLLEQRVYKWMAVLPAGDDTNLNVPTRRSLSTNAWILRGCAGSSHVCAYALHL